MRGSPLGPGGSARILMQVPRCTLQSRRFARFAGSGACLAGRLSSVASSTKIIRLQ